MNGSTSRREFLAASAMALLAHLTRAADVRAASVPPRSSSTHPTPRPGITAAKVPRREELADAEDAIPAFDMVRQIPEIADGIRCNCGCAGMEGSYSLLSCYEGPNAMAKHCQVCQGEGRLAFRMHESGKSLDEIRKGIDARFG